MKEKDLDKSLDSIIIDGLIKEAEQENADFAAEMRKMSDEEFEEMLYQPVYADDDDNLGDSEPYVKRFPSVAAEAMTDSIPAASIPQKTKFKIFQPWIAAAVSAAAVVLIVLIPSFNAMNAKLCDSALYMSEAYITPAKGGFDVSSATIDQIKDELPVLRKRFDSSIIADGKFTTYTEDFQDAGWTLAVAYLKLHKNQDAVKVLQILEKQSQGTPFGDHCKKILEQLD